MTRPITSLVFVLSFTLSACGLPSAGLPSKSISSISENPGAAQIRELTVFAAASLMDAFEEIGNAFEVANPGVKVNFNFAGSQILRTQLEQGAAADIYASADHKNMDALIAENLVVSNSCQDFSTNQLVVVLPSGNPAKLESLKDLANPGIKMVLADESVPAGKYARQILSNMSQNPEYGKYFEADVLANVVSNETDVRQVVTKVELGEADAGIVYVSDAVAAPELITIPIPVQFNIIAKYPIAILANSPRPDLAETFIGYLVSPAGQAILDKWGFIPK
jgi:molybdate transport system substrate-binding protein